MRDTMPNNYTYLRRSSEGSNLDNLSLTDDVKQSRLLLYTALDRTKNPDYKVQISKKQDASTYYYRSDATWRIPRASSQSLRVVSGLPPLYVSSDSSWMPNWNGSNSFPSSDSTTRDIALKRIKKKIASMESGYQAMIPLIELRELKTTIRQATNLTSDVIKALIQAKRTGGRSVVKQVQKIWLGYSFAVSPMMADIKGLTEAIQKFLGDWSAADHVTGSASKVWFDSYVDSTTGDSACTLHGTHSAVHRLSYKFIAGWQFFVQSNNTYAALNNFGLTPSALPSVLWEITAFSWVADYFGTVGDYLEDNFSGSAGNSVYVVENRRYEFESNAYIEYKLDNPSAYVQQNKRIGIGGIKYFEFERIPQSVLPSRTLRWKTRDEIGKGAIYKLLNLAALLKLPGSSPPSTPPRKPGKGKKR